jgi:hypothetical protein
MLLVRKRDRLRLGQEKRRTAGLSRRRSRVRVGDGKVFRDVGEERHAVREPVARFERKRATGSAERKRAPSRRPGSLARASGLAALSRTACRVPHAVPARLSQSGRGAPPDHGHAGAVSPRQPRLQGPTGRTLSGTSASGAPTSSGLPRRPAPRSPGRTSRQRRPSRPRRSRRRHSRRACRSERAAVRS